MSGSSNAPPRSWPLRALSWVGALAFSLVVTELFLRLVGLPVTELEFLGPELALEGTFVPDELLFWRLDPTTDNYVVNEHGFRGWWPEGEPHDGEFRIVCVGDSCSFGAGADYEETYGLLLERKIQDALPGHEVRAALAALPGYSTQQSLLLLEEYGELLAPDLTVLYVGTWNDYVPAMRHGDAERVRRSNSWVRSLRLSKLVERASASDVGDGDIREELLAAFRGGTAPFGRRVPEERYRANYERIIELVRGLGSQVLVVVPPLPVKTVETFPVCLEYREITREVAAAQGVSLFDMSAVIDAFAEGTPTDWRLSEAGEEICFIDWAHPSTLGHRLIAEALFAHIEAAGLLPARRPTAGGPVIASVVPSRLAPLSGGTLEVSGRGLDAARVGRAWIGPRWVRGVRAGGEGGLVLEIPDTLTPGTHGVELVTATGRILAPGAIEVGPPEITATLVRDGDALVLDVVLVGRPGLTAGAWLSPARRDEPAPTRYGPFHLVADPDGRPPGYDALPFRFDKLELLTWLGTVDEAGRWTLRERLPLGEGELPEKVWLQGGLLDPDDDSAGALTTVVELVVPRS